MESHLVGIPGLTIIDSGNVTGVSLPADEIEKMEENETKVTLADLLPGAILVDAGHITHVDGKPITI